MPRSRADERLLKRIAKEAPDALTSKADIGPTFDRLLKTPPDPNSPTKKRRARAK